MKKPIKRKSSLVAPQDESGVADLIDKLQQQLSAMEKKLDILISQCSKRPFEKSYSQGPSRRFDQSHRYDRGRQASGFSHDRGRQASGSRERTYTRVICADCNRECEIPFKPSAGRPVYCKECFSKRKGDNLFNASRDSRPEKRDAPRKRRSDKRPATKRTKPVKKKKSSSVRRKKHA